jgi:hypothetical protein
MEHIVIIGNRIAGLRLRHIRKNQIQKSLLFLLKLSFSFSYRFNVRVYGHMKFDTHNPKIILEKNKINLVQG